MFGAAEDGVDRPGLLDVGDEAGFGPLAFRHHNRLAHPRLAVDARLDLAADPPDKPAVRSELEAVVAGATSAGYGRLAQEATRELRGSALR